jgi:hypothetical protein
VMGCLIHLSLYMWEDWVQKRISIFSKSRFYDPNLPENF